MITWIAALLEAITESPLMGEFQDAGSKSPKLAGSVLRNKGDLVRNHWALLSELNKVR